MICLPDLLPLLRFGDHEVVQYDARWLQDSIAEAADRAGHPDWWLAEDVARGVIEYLRDRFPRATITLDELYERIHRALEVMGWMDIAIRLEPTPPPLRISLIDIAEQAEGGYELAFFRLLEVRLHETLRIGSRQVHCYGLRKSVKKLRAARRWGPSCDSLRDEIVAFLRQRFAHQPLPGPQFGLVLR